MKNSDMRQMLKTSEEVINQIEKQITENLKAQIKILKIKVTLLEEIIEIEREIAKTAPKLYEPSIKTVVRKAKQSLLHVVNCAYCGKEGTEEKGPDGKNWHIDHIEPKCLGGSNHPTNLVKSCATCNIKKGIRYLEPIEGTITAGNTKVMCHDRA